MKLSTGKIAFPIEFDTGDKEFIYFNPNDPDFASRFMAARDNISNKIKELDTSGVELSPSGEVRQIKDINDVLALPDDELNNITKATERMIKVVDDTKKIFFDEIDKAFGSEVSKVVFKHCSPLAVVNGEYFIVHFLTAIMPDIQKVITKSNAQLEKKMSKHLNKYNKK